MNIRESMEQRERELLSPYACSIADDSRGRGSDRRKNVMCELFIKEISDRILHCKAFRRMKDKTQVFLSAAGRSLQEPAYPYTGGIADRTYHCKGIAAE